MNKKNLFGVLTLSSFGAILFTPVDSTAWVYLLILGIILGIVWFKVK